MCTFLAFFLICSIISTPGVFLKPLHRGRLDYTSGAKCLEELIQASRESRVKMNDECGGGPANDFKIVGTVTRHSSGKTLKWEGE